MLTRYIIYLIYLVFSLLLYIAHSIKGKKLRSLSEITIVRDGIYMANPSQIFVHYHFDYDLIEFKM